MPAQKREAATEDLFASIYSTRKSWQSHIPNQMDQMHLKFMDGEREKERKREREKKKERKIKGESDPLTSTKKLPRSKGDFFLQEKKKIKVTSIS